MVSVLIGLMSDTRLIEPHDINPFFHGCGLIGQLAVGARERRLGVALNLGRRNLPLGVPKQFIHHVVLELEIS